ncbi:hypothetical protein AB0F17_15895 [Nonomuraea sp. NPDC026600]|uniref:hypothetical protein n=1 Tax=Nonomuraea sp. NPDC026600 TaxID=3155363 RepID=UPI0033FB0DC4
MSGPSVSVPVAELLKMHEQMMRLTVRVGLLLDAAGVDITGATSPTVLPDNVVRLSDRRRAVST